MSDPPAPAVPAVPATTRPAAAYARASLAKRLAAIGQYHRLANQPFDAGHPVIHHPPRDLHLAA